MDNTQTSNPTLDREPNPADYGAMPVNDQPNPADYGATPITNPVNMAQGNKTFARTLVNTMKPAMQTTEDIGKVYPVIEAGLNATTGLLFGFPASMIAATGGLISKYLLGTSADPKEMMDATQNFFTYHPMTEAGERMTGNLMYPLQKQQEWAGEAGQAVTSGAVKLGLPAGVATGAGAITDASLQMIPQVLLAEWGRKMGGQSITPADMTNTSKIIAGEKATPEVIKSTEQGLRATYDQTGIGPYTVMQEAAKNPEIKLDLKPIEEAKPDMVTVYHGSPHEFEQFDMSKIGTGEGAQAYGHGLYFAENPEVAKSYLVNGELQGTPQGMARSYIQDYGSKEQALTGAVNRLGNMKNHSPEQIDFQNKVIDAIKNNDLGGNHYKVDIPKSSIDNMLDWDKPLSEQPESVLNVIKSVDNPIVKQALEENVTGGNLYQKVAKEYEIGKQMEGMPEGVNRIISGNPLASQIFDQHGIRGIKYLDAMSRPEGEGTRNFVLFNADDAHVVERNGKTVGQESPTVPRAFQQFIEKPDPIQTSPGDGEPLLDLGKNNIDKSIDMIKQVKSPEDISAEVLDKLGIEDDAQSRQYISNIAEATRIDEQAVKNALRDHANDGEEFAKSINDIVSRETEIPETTGELHAGINPISALKDYGGTYSPYLGVAKEIRPKSALGDAILKIFAPASRGDIASLQAGILRANFGEMARVREIALEKMKKIAAGFNKLPVDKNIQFMDSMERGTPISEPKLADDASQIRALLDGKRKEVQDLGKGQLENFDENYLPHIWKDPDAASALFNRRPLEGSKAFLKARTIPYITDGMQWRTYDADGNFLKSFKTEEAAKANVPVDGRIGQPLELLTTNPVELALLKAREMDKYIYGQRIFQEMKDYGMAKFVPFGQHAPDGWTKINDKIARVNQFSEEAKGMVMRGEYYAPDEAATLINNHLSPGLQGNAFFDAWRGIGMAINSAQLGLSAFHVGFTTLDSMTSRVALGVKQISRGDVGEGLSNMAIGASPAQPFLNIYKGDKLLQAYLGKIDSPDLAPIVEAIEQSGGRVKMDDFYRNTSVNAFKQAIRSNDYLGAGKEFLPTVLDRVNAPIFEWLVPRQKLGVFFDLAQDWINKNPNATVIERRAGLGKLWDSTDNRMGQLVYDNVFWNRALKDGLMASVRSVGWNLGTFRELGGGVLDIKDIPKNKALTDRTAYVVALPMVTATYGAMLYYAYNGTYPETLKDCFFPKTGKLRPDGSEDRVSIPTYMKDVYAYGEDIKNFAEYGSDPTQTLKNKANPLISTVSQMLNNQDFYGAAIRNPSSPVTEQIKDEANYIIKQIEPFSLRNYQQQSKLQNKEPSIGDYLTSPSMIGITPAPGYITKSPEQLESSQVSHLRDPLMAKFKEEIKDGADIDKLIPEMIRSGLTREDIKQVIRNSAETPRPHRLKKFGDNEE
jgi:hypothetical protein